MPSRYCNNCGRPLDQNDEPPRKRPGRYVLCRECAASGLCSLCRAPLGLGVHRLGDGRPICAACAATGVSNPVEARALYEQVVAVVESHLGLIVRIRPGFGLRTAAGMQKLLALVEIPEGVRGHMLGVYVKLGRRREILVEEGLPRWMLIKIIAHEYGHAWQGENCPFLRDALLMEGFCEWVAYRVLGVLGAASEQARLLTHRGFYAEALQAVLRIENSSGTEGLLRHMRTPLAVA